MATLCENYLTEIKNAYVSADYYWNFGDVRRDWLITNIYRTGWDNTYRENVAYAIGWLYDVVRELIDCSLAHNLPFRLPYYLENCVGGDIDMDAILTAMLTATGEQFTAFVGIEDAYRSALWTMPYNKEYYAALARGFAQWP